MSSTPTSGGRCSRAWAAATLWSPACPWTRASTESVGPRPGPRGAPWQRACWRSSSAASVPASALRRSPRRRPPPRPPPRPLPLPEQPRPPPARVRPRPRAARVRARRRALPGEPRGDVGGHPLGRRGWLLGGAAAARYHPGRPHRPPAPTDRRRHRLALRPAGGAAASKAGHEPRRRARSAPGELVPGLLASHSGEPAMWRTGATPPTRPSPRPRRSRGGGLGWGRLRRWPCGRATLLARPTAGRARPSRRAREGRGVFGGWRRARAPASS